MNFQQRQLADLHALIAASEASCAAMRRALEAIRTDPYGCPMCDSGKLRNPTKQHWSRCGYPKLDAALSSSSGRDVLAEMERLRKEVGRLEQLVCDFQASAMIDVANQGGPCRVEPKHVETHVSALRADLERKTKAAKAVIEWAGNVVGLASVGRVAERATIAAAQDSLDALVAALSPPAPAPEGDK